MSQSNVIVVFLLLFHFSPFIRLSLGYPPQQPGYPPQSDGYGGAEDPEAKGFQFNDASIRRGFIRKVYAILMV